MPSGGFLQSRTRLQERQRRLAEGAGALLDVVPQSEAELLRAGRLLLLLRRPAVADECAADQPPAGRARRLHHAGQQVGIGVTVSLKCCVVCVLGGVHCL